MAECVSTTLASLGNMAYQYLQPEDTNEEYETQLRRKNMQSNSHVENVSETGDSTKKVRRTASGVSIVSRSSTNCSMCELGVSRTSSYTSVSSMSDMEEGGVAVENVENDTICQVHYDNSKNCKPLSRTVSGTDLNGNGTKLHSFQRFSEADESDREDGTDETETKKQNHVPHIPVLEPDQSLKPHLINCDETRQMLKDNNGEDDEMIDHNEHTDSGCEVMDQLASSDENTRAKRFNPPLRLESTSESKKASNENNNRNNSVHTSEPNCKPQHSRNRHSSNSAPLRETNNNIVPHRKALSRNVAPKRHATPSPEVSELVCENDVDQTTSGALKPSEKRKRSCSSNQNNITQQTSEVEGNIDNQLSEQEMRDIKLAQALQRELDKEWTQVDRRKGTAFAYELRSYVAH